MARGVIFLQRSTVVATGSYMIDGLIHIKGKEVAIHLLLKLVARWVIKLDVESHDKAV